MSTNLYLNNKVKTLNGFKSTPNKDHSGNDMTINGMYLFGSGKGRLYLMWNEDDTIPEELKDLVEEVSCRETIPQMSRREAGVYRHESAECELTPEDHGNGKYGKPVYMLKVVAKNIQDAKEILHKIKTGAIRPDESYEGPQGGKNRRQLENELLDAQLKLKEYQTTIDGYTMALEMLWKRNFHLSALARDFHNHSFWSPLIFKRTVTLKIKEILDMT